MAGGKSLICIDVFDIPILPIVYPLSRVAPFS